jgi:hypothetical protein
MIEHKVYKPGVDLPPRRKEWVDFPSCDSGVWVWEMTVAESAQILQRSARPSVDPRGGHDQSAIIAAQLMVSCYDSDEDGAKRIFGDADFSAIYALPFRDFDVCIQAINRVNGKDATEQEILEAFSTAQAALKNSE